MWNRRLSRRQLLALGGGALAAQLLKAVATRDGLEPLRIGAVLPTRTGLTPVRAATYQVAGEAARHGAILAEEALGDLAESLGTRLEVLIATGPTDEAAMRAARRLVAVEGVFALVGGFGEAQALELSGLAEANQILFFNIGAAGDSLRNEACSHHTFHVEASAAMYADALTVWFTQAGFHRWFFVYENSEEGEARHNRLLASLTERREGSEVGSASLELDAPVSGAVFEDIRRAGSDVVVLLLDSVSQLDFLGQYEARGLEAAVSGFPDTVTQTRTFYAASRNTALGSGSGHRVALWEATLEGHGAEALNERFYGRWGQPMDAPAWAAYQSIKILLEAATSAGTLYGPELAAYLESPQAVFDVNKSLGATFRPWDHQLRQPLYMIKINPEAQRVWDLAGVAGEVPDAVDAAERLDQLGDGPEESLCHFG
jgi:ABC-type branched-subunit amino acid transport system substrate-binding protein